MVMNLNNRKITFEKHQNDERSNRKSLRVELSITMKNEKI